MIFAASILVPCLNHLLDGAGWAKLRLQSFAGETICIRLSPFALSMQLTPEGHFAQAESLENAPEGVSENTPGVVITLPASTPFLLLQDSQRIMQQANIRGNAELAETLAFVFRNLSWDVEADLAPLVGDIMARRIVLTGRALRFQLLKGANNLALNATEYVRDEANLLPTPRALSQLTQQVTTIRDDVARLEKRIQMLEKR